MTAKFTWSPLVPRAGRVVQFTDQSDEDPTAWSWVFKASDNTTVLGTSTQRNPQFTFPTDGSYFVELTATETGIPDPPDPPTPGVATVRIGATWTHVRPTAAMDGVMAAHDYQAQHIIDFGAGSALLVSVGQLGGGENWGQLDPMVQDLVDAGATNPVIIFCRAPGIFKDSGNSSDDSHPNAANVNNWALLCRDVANRYNGSGGRPNVTKFSVWNEMKGYWNNGANRWDYEGYTTMYNAVWAAVKGARPTVKIGGPYVILQSGASSGVMSNPSALTFPGGVHDQRQLDVMTYFRDHATGWDFLSCDGGLENQFGAQIPANPQQQIQKLWGWWVWVRANIDPACPLYNFETYVNQTAVAPWNYSQAQREDLMIELARQTDSHVAGDVVYFTWFHPTFWPQVVNKASDVAWANTESPFRAKVVNYHTSG